MNWCPKWILTSKNIWGLFSPTKSCCAVRNLTLDRCSGQLFSTRVNQTLPDLTPVSILSFPNFPLSLKLAEIHKVKNVQTKPDELVIRLHSFHPVSKVVFIVQRTVLLKFSRFILLVSVQYTAYQTMHSAINCLQIFRFPIYCVIFLVTRYPFYQRPIRVYSRHSVDTIGPFRFAVCIQRPTRCGKTSDTDEKSPVESNTLTGKLLLFVHLQNIWPEVLIISHCIGPSTLHLRTHKFSQSPLLSHVMNPLVTFQEMKYYNYRIFVSSRLLICSCTRCECDEKRPWKK